MTNKDTLEDIVELIDQKYITEQRIEETGNPLRLLVATVSGTDVEIVEFPHEFGRNDARFEVIVYNVGEYIQQSELVDTATEAHEELTRKLKL